MFMFLNPRMRILCKIPAIAMALLLTLTCLPGCEMFGAPTKEQVAQADKQIEAAEKEVKSLEDAIAKLKAEQDAATKQADIVKAQRESLSAVQSRIALELANAQPEARPYLEAQLDQIRRQARSIDETAKGYAETIAAFDRDIATTFASVDSARKQLAEFDERRVAMDEATQAAQDRVTSGLASIGRIVGNFVPGAGAIGEQASQGVAAVLGSLGIGATVVGARAARRRKEAEKEKDESERKFAQTVNSIEVLRKADPAVAESMAKNKEKMWGVIDESTWEAIKTTAARFDGN
jgi:hypothetical protein